MIPVYVYDKGQCDPKKCTAKKMLKFGLAKEAKTLSSIPKGAVVLSPFAEKALSPADAYSARKGLVVMDLTWTNIEGFPRVRGAEERGLPYLLATKPINWGRPMELNSAEAVLAALVILGEKSRRPRSWDASIGLPSSCGLTAIFSRTTPSADSQGVVRVQSDYLDSIL